MEVFEYSFCMSALKWSKYDKYFRRDTRNATCLLCEIVGKEKKFTRPVGGSTSNLQRHLLEKHDLDVGNSDITPLTSAITEFFVQGSVPLHLVDSKYFKSMMNLNDNSILPSSKLVKKSIMLAVREKNEKLKNKLAKALYVSVTGDHWSSIAIDSYLGVTVHYIDQRFNYGMGCLSFATDVHHDGKSISDSFEEIILSNGIKNKMASFCGDTTQAMLNGLNEISKKCVDSFVTPCACHVIRLCLQDGCTQERIDSLLKRTKAITTYFSQSPLGLDTLKRTTINGVTGSKPKSPGATRWDSQLQMIQSVMNQIQIINQTIVTIKKSGRCKIRIKPFKSEDEELMNELFEIFSDVKNILLDLQERDASISLIIPTFYILKMKCQEWTKSKTTAIIQFGNMFMAGLEKRFYKHYCDQETNQFKEEYVISCLLSPSVRSTLSGMQELGALHEKFEDFMDHDGNEFETDVTIPPEKKKFKRTPIQEMSKAVKEKKEEADKKLTATQKFLQLEFKEGVTDLNWWKENRGSYPHIAKWVPKFLVCPPSSAESERLFSRSGQLISKKRSRMSERLASDMMYYMYNEIEEEEEDLAECM